MALLEKIHITPFSATFKGTPFAMQRCILSFVILVSFSSSQVLRPGKCPLITAQPNFSVAKFTGFWYEQVYTKRISGVNIRCNVEHFAMTGPKGFSLNSFFYSENENVTYHIRGSGVVKPSTNNSGILSITIPKMNLTGDVWVLETDYKNFAVLWNCIDLGAHYMENIEIVTREKFAKNKVLVNALNVLTKKKITKANLNYAAQTSCPGYGKLLAYNNLTDIVMKDDPGAEEVTVRPENMTIRFGLV